MARRLGRSVVAGSLFVFGEILSGRRQRAGAEAGVEAAALHLCGWGVAGGERFDRGEVRCVFDAWRSAGARRRQDCGFADAAGETFEARADEVWRGGVCDCARDRARGAGRSEADYGCAAVGGGLRELSTVAGGYAARAACVARGLLGFESRLEVGAGGDGGASGGTGGGV